MGERPLVWVQAMPLAEPGMGSKADTGLAARKCEDNVPLDWAGEGAFPHMVWAHVARGTAGSKEAHARRKSRREAEFRLKFGFLRFGNSGILLRSRSWGFGGGFLFERHLALGIRPAASAGVGSG